MISTSKSKTDVDKHAEVDLDDAFSDVSSTSAGDEGDESQSVSMASVSVAQDAEEAPSPPKSRPRARSIPVISTRDITPQDLVRRPSSATNVRRALADFKPLSRPVLSTGDISRSLSAPLIAPSNVLKEPLQLPAISPSRSPCSSTGSDKPDMDEEMKSSGYCDPTRRDEVLVPQSRSDKIAGPVVHRAGLKKAHSKPSVDNGNARSKPLLKRRHSAEDGSGGRPLGTLVLKRNSTIGIPGELTRAKSLPREQACPKLNKRKELKTKAELEDAKLEAFHALLLCDSELASTKSIEDQIQKLVRNVRKVAGTPAFTSEHVAKAVEAEGKEAEGQNVSRIDLVTRIVNTLAGYRDMKFSDVLGQILWQKRSADPLKANKRHKEASNDLSWVMSSEGCGEDELVGNDVLTAVDEVFNMYSEGRRGLCFQAWTRVCRYVTQNPILSRKVMPTEVDRLWFQQTHMKQDEALKNQSLTISRQGFKELLLNWSEAMGVHPWMVFVSIGCHAGDATDADSWNRVRRFV